MKLGKLGVGLNLIFCEEMKLHVNFLQLAHKKQAGMAGEGDDTLFVRAITGSATTTPTPPTILGFHF
ncbi:unnamed protein product [Sphenostylis stenocarpa]|uniref:Uncharacterized protein n=1 Tax=Sphenostylis stenocarpa TaxID=92480 RepID=A0AA86VCF3_9FABA|nr:unnamed protein product [Sphenostylis stenocarpa]